MTLFGRGAGGIYLHDGKSKCKVAAREGVLVKVKRVFRGRVASGVGKVC